MKWINLLLLSFMALILCPAYAAQGLTGDKSPQQHEQSINIQAQAVQQFGVVMTIDSPQQISCYALQTTESPGVFYEQCQPVHIMANLDAEKPNYQVINEALIRRTKYPLTAKWVVVSSIIKNAVRIRSKSLQSTS